MLALCICGISCLAMILCVLFKPTFRIGRLSVDSYWVVVLIGAAVMLITGSADVFSVGRALTDNSAINPLKILVLFISMTVLSIFLDELGFFSHLAGLTLRRAKASQFRLFCYLYAIVSVLTVFTSNDIIILTFTPFICYFASAAGISPLPYLIAEFTAANTWSMALIIGNPTNIYLTAANGVDFMAYLKVMLLPTIGAGTVAFLILYLLFRKQLQKPIIPVDRTEPIKDRCFLVIGLIHLGLCTVTLAISSYVGIEMWYVSLGFSLSLFIVTLVVSLVRKRKPEELLFCLKRAPWQLIPFVLSMFILIIGLTENGITAEITSLLGRSGNILAYGFASFGAANLINNIPMSVLFCSVISPLSGIAETDAVYATVIGSNIGAFLTPVGALAGIMWSSILKKNGVKFGFSSFVRYGAVIAVPTVTAALSVLSLVLS